MGIFETACIQIWSGSYIRHMHGWDSHLCRSSRQGKSHKISAFQYTVRKSIESYELMKKNGWPDANEIEYIVFEVENPRVFAIGTQVELDGKQLFIEQAWHTLNDGVLHNLYLLKLKEGFRSLKAYNTMLVGSSVSGKVVEVSRDRVMVDLDIDGPGRAAYWFPYSTMSASPDGSGWYCMPEKGDGVRVYFPTKEEGGGVCSQCNQRA